MKNEETYTIKVDIRNKKEIEELYETVKDLEASLREANRLLDRLAPRAIKLFHN